jgi:DNA (cytosine-5)-methyltransferase 1
MASRQFHPIGFLEPIQYDFGEDQKSSNSKAHHSPLPGRGLFQIKCFILKSMVMNPDYLMIDLFCGAGGTTTGAESSGHCKVIAAVNHDAQAIASHASNHSGVHHFFEDIRTLKTSKLVNIADKWKAKYPDAKLIIWASLECTNFSKAKGGLPRDADSRTLAEHLPRYVESLNPDYIMIENVEEFLGWGPLTENGKPESRKNGRDYLRWVRSITHFGYKWDWKILNAADYGAYTSRRRLFGVFHRDEVAIFPQPTHARTPQSGNMFADQYEKWKPVSEVLDLQDFGKSIFDRPKPLVDNTLNRILRGLKKYINKPMLMTCNTPGYCSDLGQPSGTITTAGHKALVTPMIQSYYGNGGITSLDEPAPTITTKDRLSLVVPMIATNYTPGTIKSVDGPSQTITAGTNIHMVTAFIDRQFGQGYTESIDGPAGSLLTNPKMNLCTAFLVNPQYSNNGNDINQPAPTVIASQRSRPLSLAVATHGNKKIEVQPGDTKVMEELKLFMQTHHIEDVFLRMLKVLELKKIQGFPEDYILLGSQENQKKFIGNAVHPKVVVAWLQAMAKSRMVCAKAS